MRDAVDSDGASLFPQAYEVLSDPGSRADYDSGASGDSQGKKSEFDWDSDTPNVDRKNASEVLNGYREDGIREPLRVVQLYQAGNQRVLEFQETWDELVATYNTSHVFYRANVGMGSGNRRWAVETFGSGVLRRLPKVVALYAEGTPALYEGDRSRNDLSRWIEGLHHPVPVVSKTSEMMDFDREHFDQPRLMWFADGSRPRALANAAGERYADYLKIVHVPWKKAKKLRKFYKIEEKPTMVLLREPRTRKVRAEGTMLREELFAWLDENHLFALNHLTHESFPDICGPAGGERVDQYCVVLATASDYVTHGRNVSLKADGRSKLETSPEREENTVRLMVETADNLAQPDRIDVKFGWVDAAAEKDFLSAFARGRPAASAEYAPELLLVNPSRGTYAWYKQPAGASNFAARKKAIHAWIEELAAGDVEMSKLKGDWPLPATPSPHHRRAVIPEIEVGWLQTWHIVVLVLLVPAGIYAQRWNKRRVYKAKLEASRKKK